ncbi:MAG: HlyD family secretion protein [Deltaproteobacteria bacterium]|nr:HlyD family secretion protein [Deltaproteobacteria bacterium]PWB61465.1 MAG: HlyD family secretion protein [Deltaproteobacteria bacterium]
MGEEENGSGNGRGRSRRKVALGIFVAASLVTIVSGASYWWYRQTHIATDDAFVEGRIHPISARIQGTVVEVLVDDNQPVKKGQPLVRIDPQPFAVRVAAAEAALSSARSDASAARSDIEAAKEDLAAARSQLAQEKAAVEAARSRSALAAARLAQARRDAERAKSLFGRHSISRERNEKVQTDLEVAKAQDDAAREELRLAEAAVPTAQALISQRQAVILQREAKTGQRRADVKQKVSALAEARLYAGYTEVAAPVDGYITRKNVESGQVVSPGQLLLAVASLSDVWVVANYKETQIGKIRPGLPVRIGVDTYPGRKFKGKVDSIMAGTGSAFSLFPPENATGNYVKVVQRVPVKIVLDRGEDTGHILRIGMSVEPTVLVP